MFNSLDLQMRIFVSYSIIVQNSLNQKIVK